MKNFKRGNTTIVVIIILAILVIGGGIYYFNKCTGPSCEKIDDGKVMGWVKYSNAQFGYSFYYPESWKVTEDAKGVSFQGMGTAGDKIVVTEVTGDAVKDSDTKFGNVVYFYDGASNTWKVTGTATLKGAKAPIKGVQKVTPLFTTASNIPVLEGTRRSKTNIIPLSADKFLVINITGVGTAVLDPLTKTITTATQTAQKSALEAAIKEGNSALKAK